MDSDGTPAPASVPPPPVRPRRGWRRFATKRFLFASIFLHLLLAVGAARWAVQQTHPAREKGSAFTGRPAANAATRGVEHQVQLAKRKNALIAAPTLRRVTSQGPTKFSLPAVPALPTMPGAAPMKPALLTGGGPVPGGGFALPRTLGGTTGVGSVTRFIGGLRITAQKLGVALDVSGSVRDYQEAMHAHVANVFKGSEVAELTSAGFYSVQGPHNSIGSVVLEFLNSPQRFDAIYVFSDFGETRDKVPAGHEDLWPEVQRLVREKKTRLYLHVLRKPRKEGNINPMLASVIQFAQTTGGSVKVGPMTQVEAGETASPANPL